MTTENRLLLLKILSILTTAYYFYEYAKAKKSLGSSQFGAEGIVNSVMPHLKINPMFKPFVSQAASHVVKNIINEPVLKDVTPKGKK